MPKLTRLTLSHKRAVGRLLMTANIPYAATRLTPGEWVRTMRATLHMTQAQLARRAGIVPAHVNLIEKGRVDPKVGTLRRVFAALYCDLAVLPVPLKRPTDIIAERTTGIPNSRIWDEPRADR
ncbi:MAG: helix-turn-helix transcriptional regulator [Elusimicrobia bacterium]|nr:helix-turn-helix transcriptional regulator [Elusimicrobiota bacterium]